MMTLMSGAMLHGACAVDSAMSGEATYLRNAAQSAANNVEQSQALFGEKAEAIQEIFELQGECSMDDWDGYGAMALLSDAVRRAADIIRALPRGTPIPEFSAEPDGSIAFDWISSRNRLFSMSIGGTDRLSYAWLDGADHGHGVAVFDGATVPAKVFEGIQGVVGRERVRLRIA